MKKLTFLSGIQDIAYGHLVNILNDDDTKSYEDCILALRKKEVDVEDNCRGRTVLRKVAFTKRTVAPKT